MDNARNRVLELMDRMTQLLSRMMQPLEPFQAAPAYGGTAFYITTMANELQAELEWLKAILEQLDVIVNESSEVGASLLNRVAKPIKTALSQLKTYLMPLLKKFLAKIWSVISHLLTPKEWKLGGKVGSTVLGLAEAHIEITFGA